MASCSNSGNTKNSTVYNDNIEKAGKFQEANKLDSAFYYFNAAKLSCNEKENDKILYALTKMCEIQHIICDFAGSEETATEALQYLENSDYKPNVYNQLGISYVEQFDYDNALKYYKKSIEATDNWLFQAIITNNIGVVYLEAKQYNKAVQVLQPLLLSDSLKQQKTFYAKSLDNLGFDYFNNKNPKGIKFLNTALNIRDSIKNDYECIASYIHMAEVYQNSDKNLSNQYAEKTFQAATNVNSPDDKLEALQFLIINSNPEQAKEWAKISIHLSDSINKVRKIARNEFSKVKYDSRKAESESAQFKKERGILFICIVFLSLIGILVYYLIRSRNKIQIQTNTYQTEIRISKRLHDELANDVFNAITFAENQDLQDANKKEELLTNLDAIYLRTRNIARENSDVDTGETYSENLQNLITSYNSDTVSIITKGSKTIHWNKISKKSKIAIHRILQELLVNMKKHSQCSVVILSFKMQKKQIEIQYSDNGIGSDDLLNFKNGLRNAENRINVINGSLTFESKIGKGFKATITCPN
jgi:predicted negative regulator of RcsB-dependent stress response